VSDLERYLAQVGEAHGFTLEELDANRQGKVHQRQLASATGVGGVLAASVLTLLAAGGGSIGAFLYYDDARKPLARLDRNALVGIVGVTALVTLFFLWVFVSAERGRRRRLAAFSRGVVEVVVAPAVKSGVQGRGGAASSWFLTFGDQRFSVLRDRWDLVTHGATYRAYTLEGRLLSFEPVAKE
jgi:hypothetical protein